MRNVKLAATQFAMTSNIEENIEKAKEMVRKAAKEGANIILLPELFENLYFCQTEDYSRFDFAEEFESSQTIQMFSALAKELGVVLPISYFEKSGNCYFNSIAIIDADGTVLGQYRKSHIPTGECYEEKFYFCPGDTGFRVFPTKFGKIGVGICWDQWFPETARILALKGAEVLLFPTAIGSEPVLSKDSKDHWQHVMQGHAAANIMPLVASNRIGTESMDGSSMTFFGSSFISNEFGIRVQELGRTEEGVLVQEFDLDLVKEERRDWGVFRDRRVDLYSPLLKLDDSK
ncbi:MAG: N-carbamoylputrescine amidase [Candidatus Enteromonas sp.]|nr:N-carbamoylputrescine amidase [Candidatus Enteromonas sp.]MDY6093745.1 N-carbamoylputrescine amidase [Candidatus Enteromonas sp.]